MSNRILDAITSAETKVAAQVADGTLKQETLDGLHDKINIDHGEYCAFQEHKSLAHANGTLSADEAITVYNLLGSGPDHFNKQSLMAKVTITKLFAELLSVA